MARFLAATLAILLVSVPAHATLAAIVPARDGLVIAADSRLTFMGASCDGAFKILAPTRPLRTVAVVTGDSVFLASPPAGTTDLCRYLATTPRLLDINAVVEDFLEGSDDDPARISINDLAAACVHAAEQFQTTHPGALTRYAGKEIFSVVVASYDPAAAASTLRNFVARVDDGSGKIEAVRITTTRLDAGSASGVWMYGETDYVNRQVLKGPGRWFLSPATIDFLKANRPVEKVPLACAEAVAGDVIRAASRSAEVYPAPSGIGGAIRVVVVGSETHPVAALRRKQ